VHVRACVCEHWNILASQYDHCEPMRNRRATALTGLNGCFQLLFKRLFSVALANGYGQQFMVNGFSARTLLVSLSFLFPSCCSVDVMKGAGGLRRVRRVTSSVTRQSASSIALARAFALSTFSCTTACCGAETQSCSIVVQYVCVSHIA
jgi:hypothetical protein